MHKLGLSYDIFFILFYFYFINFIMNNTEIIENENSNLDSIDEYNSPNTWSSIEMKIACILVIFGITLFFGLFPILLYLKS